MRQAGRDIRKEALQSLQSAGIIGRFGDYDITYKIMWYISSIKNN